MLQKLAYRIQSFMFGRNGNDQLNIALLVIAIVLTLFLGRTPPLNLIAYAPLIWAFFRMYSKNLEKRRAENQAFLDLWTRLTGVFRRTGIRLKSSREYRFFACPSCKTRVRVPRGKGKINVICPKCGEKFQKKS